MPESSTIAGRSSRASGASSASPLALTKRRDAAMSVLPHRDGLETLEERAQPLVPRDVHEGVHEAPRCGGRVRLQPQLDHLVRIRARVGARVGVGVGVRTRARARARARARFWARAEVRVNVQLRVRGGGGRGRGHLEWRQHDASEHLGHARRAHHHWQPPSPHGLAASGPFDPIEDVVLEQLVPAKLGAALQVVAHRRRRGTVQEHTRSERALLLPQDGLGCVPEASHRLIRLHPRLDDVERHDHRVRYAACESARQADASKVVPLLSRRPASQRRRKHGCATLVHAQEQRE
eukprot:scaffold69065_cov75-Phaeocystis_antarctica.AAC.4